MVDALMEDTFFSSIRLALGRHLYDPDEVITHRSILSYRISRILPSKEIPWPTDSSAISDTEILLMIRKGVLDRHHGRSNNGRLSLSTPVPV